MRVILVDDDELFLRSLWVELAAEEVDVVGVAHGGEEAVELVVELSPDVVVMDLQMPKVDGFRAAELMRERGSRAMIVALSGAAEALATRPTEADIAAFVSKGTPVSELAGTLRELTPLGRALGR